MDRRPRWSSLFWRGVRLADADVRPVPRLHGHAHRRSVTTRSGGRGTLLTMLLYLVGIVLFVDGHDRRHDPPDAAVPASDAATTTPSSSAPAAPACGPPSSSAKAGVDSAVLTKLYPTRSHTGAAQGGVCAALGNLEEDHWEWHMFDTIKGGDYLVDQDAAEVLAREAIETVIELEHMGLPFNRTPDGQDRPAPVRRPHPQLRRGAGQAGLLRRRPHRPHDPPDALPAVPSSTASSSTTSTTSWTWSPRAASWATAGGRPAWSPTGSPTASSMTLRSKAVLLATGGFGRMFRITSNAWSPDRRRRRAGLPPRHPDAGHGVLPVPSDRDRRASGSCCPRRRAARAATCSTTHGDRFMERYAPTLMELAPRDMVSRAIVPGDPRRARHRRQGLRLPRRAPPRSQDDRREAAGHHGLRPRLPGHRARSRSRSRSSRPRTTRWAASRPTSDTRVIARRGEHRRPGPVRRRARRPACPSTAPTASARTRSWTCWSSAGGPGARWPLDIQGVGPARSSPRTSMEPVRAEIEGHPRPRHGASAPRHSASELADVMMDDVGVYRDEALPDAARSAKVAELRARYAERARRRQGHRLQHRPARGARGRLPARLRRDDRGRGAGPQGEPRRPRREDYPERDDVELPDPLPRDEGRRRRGPTLAYKPVTITTLPAEAAGRTEGGSDRCVELRVLRYDPERDAKPHWEALPVEADPMDRVLDLLHQVKYEQDGTLTFRRSCAHGVCGSDAMLINGRNRLACKIRVEQLGKRKITVAPLPGLPVIKDLVVDMDDFFAKFRSVQPFLINDSTPPERERLQSARRPGASTTTRPSASCARPARRRARRSGRSPSTWGRRRS